MTSTPTLSQFQTPASGPATIASACYDAPNAVLYVIGADGNLYTYQGVDAGVAGNLLNGPARGMFSSLTHTKWAFTVGTPPTV